jgi:hypothetical protein
VDFDENWCGSLTFNLLSGGLSRAYIAIENMSFSLNFIKDFPGEIVFQARYTHINLNKVCIFLIFYTCFPVLRQSCGNGSVKTLHHSFSGDCRDIHSVKIYRFHCDILFAS